MQELNKDWAVDARCRDATDPDLWFPISDDGPSRAQIAQAKAECFACPVAADCLGWALATGQNAGIWGGTTEGERRKIA